MSDLHRGDHRPRTRGSQGDGRLGRALRDVVEVRAGQPTWSPATAGLGSRAFVATLEPGPDQPGRGAERPRFGAIVVTAVLAAVVAAAIALWPAITSHRTPAGGRPGLPASHATAAPASRS